MLIRGWQGWQRSCCQACAPAVTMTAMNVEIATIPLRFSALNVPMQSKSATRRHAVAAALAPRLKGLNITTDLMQVGKVVTRQQSYHHSQGLRTTLIVLPAALQVLG